MTTHEWEFEIGEGFEPGRAVVTTETAPPGEVDWSVADSLDAETEVFAREILRLATENAKLIKGGRVMLKAFSILAHEMWVCFKEDMDLDSDAIREALEAAGLIEMLADQTWSLTELGGRVCRRKP